MNKEWEENPEEIASRLIRISCTKMVRARAERGGLRLHKNLLILHLLRTARDQHLISMQSSFVHFPTSAPSEVPEEDENLPPLEFVVHDQEEEEDFDSEKAPMVFAVEVDEEWDENDSYSDDKLKLQPKAERKRGAAASAFHSTTLKKSCPLSSASS